MGCIYVHTVNIILALENVLIVMPIFGHVGLALATAISGTIAAAVMVFSLARQGRISSAFLPMISKITLATAIMGGAVMSLQYGLDSFLNVAAAVDLVIIVGGGVVTYALISFRIGAVPAGILRRGNMRST